MVFARKRFGQNFLHDEGVIERIVSAIGPSPQDALVEIGPGHGALTEPLLERAGRLDAIEIDRDLAATLQERFAGPGLTLHVADALRFDFAALAVQRGRKLRVVGNLPYNVSTPLLFHLALRMPWTLALLAAMPFAVISSAVRHTPLTAILSPGCVSARLMRETATRRRTSPPRGSSAMMRPTS